MGILLGIDSVHVHVSGSKEAKVRIIIVQDNIKKNKNFIIRIHVMYMAHT